MSADTIQESVNLLSFNEARKFLNISRNRLQALINNSEVAYYRPGGKLYKFKKEDLLAWVESQRIEPVISDNAVTN